MDTLEFNGKVYKRAPQIRMCDGCGLYGLEYEDSPCNDKSIYEQATQCCASYNEDEWFIWEEIK